MNGKRAGCLVAVAISLAMHNAGCINLRRQLTDPAPVVFNQTPTMDLVIKAVNGNSAPIRSLQANDAKLALQVQGMPALRANLALESPRNLRMRADFIGVGQVLDFGSNDEMFWALIDAPEIATNIPRGVYHARHDQFRRSAMGQFLPIKPDWLIDAFGVVQLDPAGMHEGPYAHAPGKMQIRTRLPSSEGDVMRIMVLDDRHGWVLEQHLYDSRGQLIVSSNASDYRYYHQAGVSLPHRVAIQLPPPQNSFYIDVQTYSINQLYSDPAQLWTMPPYEGYQRFDLAGAPPAPPATQPPPPPGYSFRGPVAGYPATSYRPSYRGYSAPR